MKDLKIIYARHNRTRAVEAMPPAVIHYHDLTSVISGELVYTLNKKTVTLHAGDIILIRRGEERARSEGNTPSEYLSLNFGVEGEIPLPSVMRGALTSELMMQIALFDELVKKFYPDAEPMLSPLATCFITTLARNLESETLPPLVRKIVDYIHANLSEKITLSDIGSHTFFSPIYCDTVFKTHMGRSILDYVIEKRIDESKKLILHDTLPLSRIAESVGFSDYNYFARTFKKRCGYTPLEYKKLFATEIYGGGGRLIISKAEEG